MPKDLTSENGLLRVSHISLRVIDYQETEERDLMGNKSYPLHTSSEFFVIGMSNNMEKQYEFAIIDYMNSREIECKNPSFAWTDDKTLIIHSTSFPANMFLKVEIDKSYGDCAYMTPRCNREGRINIAEGNYKIKDIEKASIY